MDIDRIRRDYSLHPNRAEPLIPELCDEVEKLRGQRDELLTSLQRLSEAIDGLTHSSEGVAGLHRNGDVATWEELCKGGRFEEWLTPWSDALGILAKHETPCPRKDHHERTERI
jgi:hypothetical protein